MKKTNQVIAVLMALVMCFCLASCSGEGEKENTTTTTTVSTTVTTTTPAAGKPDDPDTGDKGDGGDNGDTDEEEDNRISQPTVAVPESGNITTAEELHAVLVNGDATKDYTVTATELDMAAYSWTGLFGYSGTFDFGGCTIKNAADSLFISVNGGTVKNLTIANSKYVYDNEDAMADVSAVDGTTAENKIFSPVIRYATDVKVSNVTIDSTVSIEAAIYLTDTHHGGIIGETVGSYVVVENCTFKGTFVNDSMLVNFGGIVGKMYSNDTTVVNVDEPEKSTNRIVGCFNYGKIEHLGVASDSKVAGIVGYAENVAVIGCANYGEVISADDGQTAGVAGYAGGAVYIKNCLNTGAVEGVDAVGGICGYSNGEIRYFTNCINIGKISGTERVGGMVGMMKNKETLTNCFNLSSAHAVFSLDENRSGIVPSDKSTHKNLVITNCDNVDSVATILSLINATAPGVFVANGDSIALAV